MSGGAFCRRDFLRLGATALGALALPGALACATRPRSALELVRALFPRREAAAAVGRRYLAEVPSEADVDRLLRAVFDGWSAGDLRSARAPAQLRARLARQRRGEFARGEVFELSGVVAARSELRLCAIAALV